MYIFNSPSLDLFLIFFILYFSASYRKDLSTKPYGWFNKRERDEWQKMMNICNLIIKISYIFLILLLFAFVIEFTPVKK
jgi:predicted PurR-regulated permease PerM